MTIHRPKPPRLPNAVLAAVVAFLAATGSGTAGEVEGGFFGVRNGLPGTQQIEGGPKFTGLQSMLWKYTARCALREDQELEEPGAKPGGGQKLRGWLGIAPEWHGGACDRACQEKVSSCLIALTNRTGKHVLLSLLSAVPAMGPRLTPDKNDLAFPHQEGAFFGNVFSGEAYACQGRDVRKAAQVKRFCALEPATCSGFAQFTDAGRCEDVCTAICFKLPDGSQRCPAAACKDPRGRVWSYPVTTFMRNKIEAANADVMKGTVGANDVLEDLDDGDSATYRAVDFGPVAGSIKTFAATFAAKQSRGRIEVWLEGGKRLGVLQVRATGSTEREETAPINATAISGSTGVVLKFFGGMKVDRLSAIEFR